MLDKLGAPLLGAVSDVSVRKNANGNAAAPQEAVAVAELLGKSVQISVTLAERMDLRDAGGDADAVRLALAGLAAGLVAGHYRQADKAPDDNEIKRLVNALEAVLVFADNFTAAAENTARLQALVPGIYPADESQVAIQYVHALAPVASEITSFAFGRPEKKLAQDVAARLMAAAAALRARLVSADGAGEERRAELGALRALAMLYVDCHRAEKARLSALSAGEKTALPGGEITMERLWQDFDTRTSMLETLVQSALPQAGGVAETETLAPHAAVAPSVIPPPAAAPGLPPTVAAVAPQDQSGDYSPMSFFKPGQKKGEDGKV